MEKLNGTDIAIIKAIIVNGKTRMYQIREALADLNRDMTYHYVYSRIKMMIEMGIIKSLYDKPMVLFIPIEIKDKVNLYIILRAEIEEWICKK